MAVDIDKVIATAKTALGVMYQWGGNSLTNGVDCSGLIVQAYKAAGVSLPRTTYQQINVGKKVSFGNLRPGDMVFFDTEPGTAGPDHVGMYLGGGKMIEAPRTGKPVRIVDITKGYYHDTFMGARRVPGAHPGALDYSDGGSNDAKPDLSPEELAASYGWASSFLNHHSELKKLFKQAVGDQWTPDKFQAKLRNTTWWKSTSDTARKLQVQKETDPAAYRADVEATTLHVRQFAAQLGAAIPSKNLSKIVDNVMKTGMDDDGLRLALGNYIDFSKTQTVKGEAGMHAANIREYAYNMGVNLSDDAVANYAANLTKKLGTDEDYKNFINQQAVSAFPGYADDIAGGTSVRDLADPYIQQLSSTLGIPASAVSIQDPRVRQAMNGLGQDGQPRGMSQTEFAQTLRQDPAYGATNGAMGQAMSIGGKVLRDLGFISG